MLGRRTAIAAVFCSAVAFGGGAALAATHGSAHHPAKAPALKPVKHQMLTQHFTRHHCHDTAAFSAANL